ncbi:hypothetical protein OE749_13930 [Aestuariibacter sp. AA17]|uniref:MSHA biogenesis protein MshI n=1 Tax=Fluctibacter corallii TaxID=2984329 RepID=A0ABT3AAS8_9ALTE|nr:hypothetical protein [Aestuariibacter sp. AA17]MCV2885792.1 hypothetical protein [Aestuariibacter sp. AA17]
MVRAGWREFIKTRLQATSNFHAVGIEFSASGIQILILKRAPQGVAVHSCHSLAYEGWETALSTLVESQKLHFTPTFVSIHPNLYQLFQLERPRVEDSEMRQALSWTAADVLGHEQPMAIDYFDMPVQTSGANKVNVVAVTQSHIQSICDGLKSAQLSLKKISVAELDLLHLIDTNEQACLIIFQRHGGELSLVIAKQGCIYFIRRLRGYENLSTLTEQALNLGVIEELSVEIQRSLDYYESQLRQAPVRLAKVIVESRDANALERSLEKALLMPVENIMATLNHTFPCDSDFYAVSLSAAMTQERGRIDLPSQARAGAV